MSKYIIEIPDEYFASYDTKRDMYYPDERDSAMPITPLVRCRDCKYYGCYDGSTWCSRTYEQVPGGTCDYQTVEPDGFCAWGEREYK